MITDPSSNRINTSIVSLERSQHEEIVASLQREFPKLQRDTIELHMEQWREDNDTTVETELLKTGVRNRL